MPLTTLTDRAEAVIVGRIVQGTVLSDRSVTMLIDVEKNLKGSISAGATVTAAVRLRQMVSTLTIYKERGLFFLVRSSNGSWNVLPLVTGSIRNMRSVYFVMDDSARPKATAIALSAPIEKVYAEVLGALDSPQGQANDSPIDLAMDYRLMMKPSPALRSLIADLGRSSQTKLRQVALNAGLVDGDERALAQLQQNYRTMAPADLRPAIMHLQYLRDATPGTARRLAAIAQSTSGELQLAALGALARIHDRESVPVLAQFLNNPDVRLRGMAVAGLARFANNVPPGEHHPLTGEWKYRTEDTLRYSASDEQSLQNNPAILSFWKSWWNKHQPELRSVAP